MRAVVFALVLATAQWAIGAEGDAEARKKLEGTWKGGVQDGATGHVLTFTTAQISGTRDGKQDLGAGTFKLDLKSKPCKMDATRTKGGRKGVYLGIYSVEGDTLKWCVSTPGNNRPTEFATKDGQFLLVLKRQKDQ